LEPWGGELVKSENCRGRSLKGPQIVEWPGRGGSGGGIGKTIDGKGKRLSSTLKEAAIDASHLSPVSREQAGSVAKKNLNGS